MEGEGDLEKSHCENCPLSRTVNQIGHMYSLREEVEEWIGQWGQCASGDVKDRKEKQEGNECKFSMLWFCQVLAVS